MKQKSRYSEAQIAFVLRRLDRSTPFLEHRSRVLGVCCPQPAVPRTIGFNPSSGEEVRSQKEPLRVRI